MNIKEVEKKLDEILKDNEELRKVFEKHPERRKLYIDKIIDSEASTAGSATINPKYCRTCRFSRGDPPFEDLPEKAHCMIYSYDNGEGEAKPPDVYYEGAKCEYYEKD